MSKGLFYFLSTIIIMVGFVILFTVKYNVHQKIAISEKLSKIINEEEEMLKILNAEFTYITRPQNLESILNQVGLSLKQIDKGDIINNE